MDSSKRLQERLQGLLDRQIGRGVRSVAAAAQSEDGRVDFAGAAEAADPASGAPMQPDTPYALASVTKLYTAAVVFKLCDDGLLDLDTPIVHYLPASLIGGIHHRAGRDSTAQIRVHHLLSHTSGLPDYFLDAPPGSQSVFDQLMQGRDRALTIEDVVALARATPARFEPGAPGKAHYSDTNFRLLGAVIEAVTGQTTAAAFEKTIFVPLGLRATHVYNAALADERPAPAAIFFKDKALSLLRFLSSNVPDGGIVSTARENLVFLRAFFDGRLFDRRHFSRMTAQWNAVFFPFQYGCGLMRLKLPRVFSPLRPIPAYLGHSGSTGSFAYYCPEKALYLTGTINQIATPGRAVRLMMQLANAASG